MRARDYHVWYSSRRWRRISRLQLRLFPICCMCEKSGQIVPANVADHVTPHKGNAQLFWYGKLQSLCWHHHNSTKAQQEKKGYTNDIGLDGWPSDPLHPANRTLLQGRTLSKPGQGRTP